MSANRNKCEPIQCSEYCGNCLSFSKCFECKKIDPNNGLVGIVQTYDNQCITCEAKNGLITVFGEGALSTTPQSCKEICGDGITHQRTYEYHKLKKALNGGVLSGGLELDPSQECDDGNTESGEGCNGVCTIEQGFVCSPESAGIGSAFDRSKCYKKTTGQFSFDKESLIPLMYNMKFTKRVFMNQDNLLNNYKVVIVQEKPEDLELHLKQYTIPFKLQTED
jgi:cysteine-rich repeat protein